MKYKRFRYIGEVYNFYIFAKIFGKLPIELIKNIIDQLDNDTIDNIMILQTNYLPFFSTFDSMMKHIKNHYIKNIIDELCKKKQCIFITKYILNTIGKNKTNMFLSKLHSNMSYEELVNNTSYYNKYNLLQDIYYKLVNKVKYKYYKNIYNHENDLLSDNYELLCAKNNHTDAPNTAVMNNSYIMYKFHDLETLIQNENYDIIVQYINYNESYINNFTKDIINNIKKRYYSSKQHDKIKPIIDILIEKHICD